MPANFESAFALVKELAATFKTNEKFYLSQQYQEAEARRDFIDKFLLALGWDVNHDTQKNPYEQEVKSIPTVSGWIASPDDWGKFRLQWQKVLNEFDKVPVPYFHFSELNKKDRLHNPNNPYYQWSDAKVDLFLDELSIVAGCASVPTSSHGTLNTGEPDPYPTIFEKFFKDCFYQIKSHWPKFNDRVDFFFESTRQNKWANLILEAANNFRKKDGRLGAISFPTSDDPLAGLQFQAADLLAGALRQNAQWYFSNKKVREWRIIDLALSRNNFPKGHQKRISDLDDEKQARLIRALRKEKDAIDITRQILGLGKMDFSPLEHLKKIKEAGKKLDI